MNSSNRIAVVFLGAITLIAFSFPCAHAKNEEGQDYGYLRTFDMIGPEDGTLVIERGASTGTRTYIITHYTGWVDKSGLHRIDPDSCVGKLVSVSYHGKYAQVVMLGE